MQTQMLIGGRLVAGEAAAQPEYDAASGAQIAAVPEAAVAQVGMPRRQHMHLVPPLRHIRGYRFNKRRRHIPRIFRI